MELIIIVAIVLFLLWLFGLLGGIRKEASAWGDRALKQSRDLRIKAAEARLENLKTKDISQADIEALAAYDNYVSKVEALDL